MRKVRLYASFLVFKVDFYALKMMLKDLHYAYYEKKSSSHGCKLYALVTKTTIYVYVLQ